MAASGVIWYFCSVGTSIDQVWALRCGTEEKHGEWIQLKPLR